MPPGEPPLQRPPLPQAETAVKVEPFPRRVAKGLQGRAPVGQPVIGAALVEEALYEEAARTLREVQGRLEITAARHGVPAGETANELYHILFGGINEELVRRGLTAAPPDRPGEGRDLQCIRRQNDLSLWRLTLGGRACILRSWLEANLQLRLKPHAKLVFL